MIGIVCTSICFSIFILSFCYYKKIYHPSVSFTFLYSLILLFAVLRLYDFYEAPDEAYVLITMGVLAFWLGSESSKKIRFTVNKHSTFEYQFSHRNYYIFICLCLLVALPQLFSILIYMLDGHTVGDVYVTVASGLGDEIGGITESSIGVILMQFIAYPILYLIVSTSVVLFFREFKYRYMIIAISFILMRVLFDSRRTDLISIIIYIFIAYSRHSKDEKMLEFKEMRAIKRIKKWIPILLTGIFGFFVMMSYSRASTLNQEVDLFKTFYSYYGGCVQYFGMYLESFENEYTYGFTTLRGLFAPFFGVLTRIGIDSPAPYQRATDIVNGMHYAVMEIAPEINYNSFTTCFYQFYCDGGVIGVIILSFLFGVVSQTLFKKFYKDDSLRYEAKYLYFFGSILMLSFTNMRSILACIVWPLIIDRFLYHKIKR